MHLVDGLWVEHRAISEQFHRYVRAHMLEIVEGQIAKFYPADRRPATDVRRSAHMFLGMLTSFANYPDEFGSGVDAVADFAEHAVAIFMRGGEAW
jgi:hypothetical protein